MVVARLAAMLALGPSPIDVHRIVASDVTGIHTVAPRSVLHPLHTSLTEIVFEGTRVTMTVRTHADDVDSVLARAGVPVPASNEAIGRYVMQRVGLADANAAAIRLESCGVERRGEAVISCLRSTSVPRTALTVRNELLFDLFSDQINIVQVRRANGRRTMILTRAAPRKVLE